MRRIRLREAHKVAVLLLSIDRALATEVLKQLPQEHVELVARAMHELEGASLDAKALQEVQVEALRRLRGAQSALRNVSFGMRAVLEGALGPEQGRTMADQVREGTLKGQPMAAFDSLPPEELANLLTGEHPQIAAVFLAHLGPERAGKVLSAMPEEARPEMVCRIATLDKAPQDQIRRVLEVMRRKVKDLALSSGGARPGAWRRVAAEILNNFDGPVEQGVLGAIAENDPGLAESIREEMFNFDDLAHLDKRAMQKVISSVDTRSLALSLKACEPATEENVLRNLSKRARDMIVEEKESFGPVPLSDVLDAQRELVKIVRQLAETGEVRLGKEKETFV